MLSHAVPLATGVLLAVSLGPSLAPARSAGVHGAAAAHPARERLVLDLKDRWSTQGDTTLLHEGRATGTVSGTAQSAMTMTGNPLRAKVVVWNRHGSLQLLLRGRVRHAGAYDKFAFSAKVEGGSRNYVRVKGSGTFTGTMNRHTWHYRLNGSFSLIS